MNNHDLAAFRESVLDDTLTQDVWREKYRFGEEASIAESRARVVGGVYVNDPSREAFLEALELVRKGVLVPAGRVNAGAGTDRRVTLLNCFVNQTVQDSMAGINRAIARAALTMQQGGGIGTDFSTVRPRGALVRRTGSVSSGVIPFMDQMSMMCETVVSGGNRRGAMMGVLDISHPDVWNPDHLKTGVDHRGAMIMTSPSFISAKRTPGRMTSFNVSVLVSDAFVKARDAGEDWDLGHHAPRADGAHVAVYDRPFPYDEWEVDENLLDGMSGRKKGELAPWYVYRCLPARKLWDEILRLTYKYAEPGVIFIDRVNERNNLRYCEDIRCSNPCGEQMLPPNNVCCLGSVNLAFLVKRPFTPEAAIDYALYHRAIRTGVRFLDNVLDVTNYPLKAQHEASMAVRRIGLGITGFGDALVQMGIRYGSEESIDLAYHLSQVLQTVSYSASADLACERGPFPAFDSGEFMKGYNVGKLPRSIQSGIGRNGIRNGVLNTIAPNGTISLYVGNVSSGHEPVFSFRPSHRKVRQPDGTVREYEVIPYSLRLFRDIAASGGSYFNLNTDEYMVGALDLTPEDHLVVHGAWQEHIDAAVSKTVNCHASMSFDDFAAVYDRAFALGAKGVTTYRPDPDSGRGSVLSEAAPEDPKMTQDQVDDALGGNAARAASEVPTPGTIASSAEAAHDAPTAAETPIGDDSDLTAPPPRPGVLDGRTYKIKWPGDGINWYVTVTNDGRRVRELFIAGGDPEAREFVEALARTATAVLRRDGDVRFLAEELERIASPKGGHFIDQLFRPSVVAAIGGVLRAEIERLRFRTEKPTLAELEKILREESTEVFITPEGEVRAKPGLTIFHPPAGGEVCRKCGSATWVREAGCQRCLSCGFEVCG